MGILDLSGLHVLDLNSPEAQSTLASVRQYDPRATYVQRQDMSGQGDLIGNPYFQLSFDPSKLPGLDGTGSLTNYTSSATDTSNRGMEWQGPNFIQLDKSNYGDRVIDPSKVQHSSTYGDITNSNNITPLDPKSWLDYGPLIVAAFAGGIAGIPGLTEGFGSQFATGGATGAADAVSGAFTDPWDAMGNPSSYGLGAVNTPVGSAESSLYGPSVGSDPVGAFNGSAPITELSTPARIGDVLRNGGIPGLDNIRQSISELGLSDLANVGKAIAPALSGTPSGGGLLAGGGGAPQGFGQGESAMSILKKWYADDPNIRGLLQQKGLL